MNPWRSISPDWSKTEEGLEAVCVWGSRGWRLCAWGSPLVVIIVVLAVVVLPRVDARLHGELLRFKEIRRKKSVLDREREEERET